MHNSSKGPPRSRSPKLNGSKKKDKRKPSKFKRTNSLATIRNRPKWAWDKRKQDEREHRKQLFLYEGPEDGPINLQNDGGGGNMAYRARKRRQRRLKLHRNRRRSSAYSKSVFEDEPGQRRTFYTNEETDESYWDRPIELPTESEIALEWKEIFDDATSTYYYKNLLSGKTIWRVPIDIDKDYIKILVKRRANNLAAERVVNALVNTIDELNKCGPPAQSRELSKEYILRKSSVWSKHSVLSNFVDPVDDQSSSIHSHTSSLDDRDGDMTNVYYRNSMNILDTRSEKPEGLPAADLVAIEWDEGFCSKTGTYFYQNRFDQGLKIYRYPKYVDMKRVYKILATRLVDSILTNHSDHDATEHEKTSVADSLSDQETDISQDLENSEIKKEDVLTTNSANVSSQEETEIQNIDSDEVSISSDQRLSPNTGKTQGEDVHVIDPREFRIVYNRYIAIAEGRYVPSVESSESIAVESEEESIDDMEENYGHGKSVVVKRQKIPYSDRFSYFESVKNFFRFGHKALHIQRLLTHKTRQVMDISKWKKSMEKTKERDFYEKFGQGLADNLSLVGLFARGVGPDLPHTFDEEGIDVVFREALEYNDHLIFLDLSKNTLRERGTIALMRSIKVNSKLFELDLSNCDIMPKGGTAIMKALSENSTLGRLILQNNQLKDKGCVKIFKSLTKNKTLKYLNLDNNGANEKSIRELDRCMRRNVGLEMLSIANNPWVESLKESIVNSQARATTQIKVVEGDHEKSDREIIRSVVACMVGAIGRDEDASFSTAKPKPVLQYYEIALQEGDDNLLLLNHKETPEKQFDYMDLVPKSIVELVDHMCASVQKFRDDIDPEVITLLKELVDSIVTIEEGIIDISTLPNDASFDVNVDNGDTRRFHGTDLEVDEVLRKDAKAWRDEWNEMQSDVQQGMILKIQNEVEIVVSTLSFTVAWTDTSEVENGLAELQATRKGKYDMKQRRARAQKRRDLVQLEKDLIRNAYSYNYKREWELNYETKVANWGVVAAYRAEKIYRFQLEMERQRCLRLKPILGCLMDAVAFSEGERLRQEEEDQRLMEAGEEVPARPVLTEDDQCKILEGHFHRFLENYSSEDIEDEIVKTNTISDTDSSMPKLLVSIEQAKGLADADLIGLSDPYVIVFLNGEEIGRTRVIDNDLNPKWNEVFEIPINDDFSKSWIRFEIYDDDLIGSDEFLGQVNFQGHEVLDRCTKASKYFTLLGSVDKDNTYVKGRLKLLFCMVGDGGSANSNKCYEDDFDLPLVADTALDYLIYGLSRSKLRGLRVDNYGFLPLASLMGKVYPSAGGNSENEDDVENKEENAQESRQPPSIESFNFHRATLSRLENAVLFKSISFNKAVTCIDVSGNDLSLYATKNFAWLWTVSPSLVHVNMTMCGFQHAERNGCLEAMAKALIKFPKPLEVKLGKSILFVQKIYRGDGHEPFEDRSYDIENSNDAINYMEDVLIGLLINANESFPIRTVNGIAIEGESIVDYGKRKLKFHESIFIANRLHYDTNVKYLNLESCLIDRNKDWPMIPSGYLATKLVDNDRLTDLNLSKCAITTAEPFRSLLQENQSLKVLNISDNPLGNAAAPLIIGLKSNEMLQTLIMGDCELTTKMMEHFATTLEANSSLLNLCLPFNRITRYGAHVLAEGLKNNNGLKKLDLNGCSIGTAGATSFAEMLKKNTVLVDINLGVDPMASAGGHIEQQGALQLASMLRVNTTLKALRLPCSGIEPNGAVFICQALHFNTTLQTLDISGPLNDHIVYRQPLAPTFHKFGDESDDEDDVPTQRASESRESLMTRERHQAELRRQRKERLMARLRGAPGFDGRIGVQGARAVSDMLRINSTLTELDISHNIIQNEGIKLVCDGLKDNTKLVGIDLSDSMINEQCARFVVKMLKERADLNLSLRYMVFWGAELGMSQVNQIQAAASRQWVTIWAHDNNPLFYMPDRDDDPEKDVREVEEKIRERQEVLKGMSRFLMYHEDFPYCCRQCGINDNFEKIENVVIKKELQDAVASGNQKILDKLLDRVTAENHIAKAEEQKEEIREKRKKGILGDKELPSSMKK